MAPIDAVKVKKKSHKDHRDQSKKKSKKRKHEIVELPSSNPSPTKKSKSKAPETISRSPSVSSEESLQESPFHQQTLSLYVGVSPISQLHPLRGICAEHLSPLILTYYPPLQGVVLSYSNPRVSDDFRGTTSSEVVLSKHVDEYGVSLVWVTADFLVFKPQKNAWIKGWVNLQNEGHIGLVCWNLFNASIDRKSLPMSWKWIHTGGRHNSKHIKWAGQSSDTTTGQGIGDSTAVENGHEYYEGYFEDGKGNKVEGELKFRIKDIDATAGADRERNFLSIEGSLLTTEEEEEEQARRAKADEAAMLRRNGASTNGGDEHMGGVLPDKASPAPKTKKKKGK